MSETPTNGHSATSQKLPGSEPGVFVEKEADRLRTAASNTGRNGHRDGTMVLISYRHGFRACELVGLRWDQVDFEGKVLHVRRAKRGSRARIRYDAMKSRRFVSLRGSGSVLYSAPRPAASSTTNRWFKIVARAERVAEARGSQFIHAHAPDMHADIITSRTRWPRTRAHPVVAGPSEHPAYGSIYRPGPQTSSGTFSRRGIETRPVRQSNRVGIPRRVKARCRAGVAALTVIPSSGSVRLARLRRRSGSRQVARVPKPRPLTLAGFSITPLAVDGR